MTWWRSLSSKQQVKLITSIFGILITTSGVLVAVNLYTTNINENVNTNTLATALTSVHNLTTKLSTILTNANVLTNSLSNTSELSTTVNFHYPNWIGNHPVKISPTFENAWDACHHYLANYRNLYPYFLFNKQDNNFPLLRSYAFDAYWDGQICEKNKEGKVQLVGIEKTAHIIEAKFNNDSDYVHIANGYGIYRSRLVFDSQGRFIERMILPDKFHKQENDEYLNFNFKQEKTQFDDDGNHLNHLRIVPQKEFSKQKLIDDKDFSKAISKYIQSRIDMHDRLSKEGCGVISIEPIDLKTKDKNDNSKIVFLCFDSHVRVMERLDSKAIETVY